MSAETPDLWYCNSGHIYSESRIAEILRVGRGAGAGDVELALSAPELLATVKTLLAMHVAHHNHMDHAAARKLVRKIEEAAA